GLPLRGGSLLEQVLCPEAELVEAKLAKQERQPLLPSLAVEACLAPRVVGVVVHLDVVLYVEQQHQVRVESISVAKQVTVLLARLVAGHARVDHPHRPIEAFAQEPRQPPGPE